MTAVNLDIQVERWPIDRLIPRATNPRTHSPQQVAQIAASIREFGWTNPILVGSDDDIIAGHARLAGGRLLGLTEVPVIVLDHLSEAQRRALVIADNQLALNAGWDEELLRLELAALQEDNFDLTLAGFEAEELARLLAAQDAVEGPADPGAQMDRAEELQAKWKTASGQVWEIPSSTTQASHRLACGDSTLRDDVARLLNGERPHLMVTDPPFGVSYSPEWRAEAGINKNRKKMGKVQNDERADWREAWALFPGSVAYVWHAGRFASIVQESLNASGFEIVSQIIWAKDRFALSRGDYHWKHEPCWYAVRKGQKHQWSGARDQHTLWEIPRADDAGHGHGTQKPVECMLRPIQNNSKRGDAIYEPFLGSGSGMVAAEQSGRVCYGLEIEPKYCGVILERMAGMGLTPALVLEEQKGASRDAKSNRRATVVEDKPGSLQRETE